MPTGDPPNNYCSCMSPACPYPVQYLPQIEHRASPEDESRMEIHYVFYSPLRGVELFRGPLWACLEYVKAVSRVENTGGHYVIQKATP